MLEEMRLRVVCERVLQMGHRRGRWSSGVAMAAMLMLSEGTPRDVNEWTLDLDQLEASVRGYIGRDASDATG